MALQNRIDLLRSFLVAFDALNFREAAVRLSVSPQVVSRAIKELEAQLGEPLFHRSTRSVVATDFAQRFAPEARQAVQAVDGLFAVRAAAGAERLQGTVRVAAPTLHGRRFVLPALAGLVKSHPGLCIDLRLSDEVVDAVEQRIDVGLRSGRLRDSRFVARTVSRAAMHICAAPALLRRTGPVTALDQLDTLPTTRLIDRNTGRPWPWTLRREREFLPAAPAFVTDDPQAECEAVLAGVGIGQLSGALVDAELRRGALVELLPEWAPRPWPLSVYRVQREPVPARVRLVFDALVAALQAAG
jgi:DNA-binding transcriptional LysR family regulator